MISKPIAPPWNDSSKNLVKDLALYGQRFHYHLMTPIDAREQLLHCQSLNEETITEEIYPAKGAYAPSLQQNLRVLKRLVKPDPISLYHFFFAPNPKSSLSAAAIMAIKRKKKTIQTVCSKPRSLRHIKSLLFAERIIVLSKHTQSTLLNSGIKPEKLHHIRPGIALPDPISDSTRQNIRNQYQIKSDERVIIFPGDYQFSSAAQTFAHAIAHVKTPNTRFIFACRIKEDASLAIEAEIDQNLRQAGLRDRVIMRREVPDILNLLGSSDLCVLPAEDLYAKMDLPLVLIEAQALGLPMVIVDRPPLNELLVRPEIGQAIPPKDPIALAHAIDEELLNPHAQERQKLARAYYDISDISKKTEMLYHDLLEQS